MTGPDAPFWQARFESGDTPWDRGAPSGQLLAWIESGVLRPCRIAVPGCGSGWEVAELARRGFEVVAVDYTEAACGRTSSRLAASGLSVEVVRADALDWRPDRPFDAVYEQTCLCALEPARWEAYERLLHAWVAPGGILAAAFMQTTSTQGPPFACPPARMRELFAAERWEWPAALVAVPHPLGLEELTGVLRRR